MKREILFRGKRTDNGEWIYGYLIGNNVIVGEVVDFDEDYFNTQFWYKVDPETVGQFTGLTDKNGAKIFDGDIVRFYDDSEDELTNGVVIFNDDLCSFCVSMKGHEDVMLMAHWQYEVIVNIYDNLELLKQ